MPESPYLAFIVGLHVATGAALISYFRHDWARIVTGVILLAGERARRRSGEHGAAQQPAMAAPATPQRAMTVAGYPAQSPGRYPASPLSGLRQQPVRQPADSPETTEDRRLAGMGYGKAIVIGTVRVFALLPGISRDGMVTVTGMFRGLSREDAVRYSFLLSAPVILAAGHLLPYRGPGQSRLVRHPLITQEAG